MQLTVRDVCQLLKAPENKVQRWACEGGLLHHRAGGQVHFNQLELVEWAAPQHETAPRPYRSWKVRR
ncbi:MAG: helix-turn-helix domain-containing protein [Verrucomicrobia bacterium]|nr:helix-turn-helix domain-containing protein [Verrucomicrobiota bacterium]